MTTDNQVKCPKRNSCLEYGRCASCGVNRLIAKQATDLNEMERESAALVLTEWILHNRDRGLPIDYPQYVAKVLHIPLTL